MKLFEQICLGVVTAGVLFLLVEAGLFFRYLRADADQLTTQYARLVPAGLKTEAQIAAAADTIAQVGAQERSAFQNQQSYFGGLSIRTNTLFDSLNGSILSVNGVLIPHLTAGIDAFTDATQKFGALSVPATEAITAFSSDSHLLFVNGEGMIQATTADLTDPGIHRSFMYIAHGTGELDGSATDIHTWIHRETTPVRGTWNVIRGFLQSFAGPAAQVATAVK